MRISDWSSDVCSSDLDHDLALDEWPDLGERRVLRLEGHGHDHDVARLRRIRIALALNPEAEFSRRLLRIFCRARAVDHRSPRLGQPPRDRRPPLAGHRESGVYGTGGVLRVNLGGRRTIKKT